MSGPYASAKGGYRTLVTFNQSEQSSGSGFHTKPENHPSAASFTKKKKKISSLDYRLFKYLSGFEGNLQENNKQLWKDGVSPSASVGSYSPFLSWSRFHLICLQIPLNSSKISLGIFSLIVRETGKGCLPYLGDIRTPFKLSWMTVWHQALALRQSKGAPYTGEPTRPITRNPQLPDLASKHITRVIHDRNGPNYCQPDLVIRIIQVRNLPSQKTKGLEKNLTLKYLIPFFFVHKFDLT